MHYSQGDFCYPPVLYHSHCYGGQHCHDTPRHPGPGNRLAHALRCGAGLCHSKG